MEKTSDRERLEKLAQEKEQKRQQAATKEQKDRANRAEQEANLLTHDQQKTDEIFQYCQQQFTRFKLVPTGHEVGVGKAESSRIHGIEADLVEFVSLHITHWEEETGNFQGQIPVLLARYRNGAYQVIDSDGERTSIKTFDQLKEKLIEALSDVDTQALKRLFQKVRSRVAR